jgi:hypothetical protein
VAVILPYEEHIRNRKHDARMRIKEARAIYNRSGISAEEVHELSKKELEEKR